MESAGEEGVGVREGEEGVQRCINQFFVLDCRIVKEEKCTTNHNGHNPSADFVQALKSTGEQVADAHQQQVGAVHLDTVGEQAQRDRIKSPIK